MTPSCAPDQPGAEPPSRRGRKPESIEQYVGDVHRAWLESVRSRLQASGLTLDDLVARSGYSKARISELLRGKGYYPGWQITYSVARALDIPAWPMRRLWTAAAREAHKKDTWIHDRIHDVQPLQPEQPQAHQGFTQMMLHPYTAYARAFLQSSQRSHFVVAETFDILWLTWDEALTSASTPRHAWKVLRSRVMLRADRHREGHPDLRMAAFATRAQAEIRDPGQRLARITELARFFDAIARLPTDQLDVAVLRYLCGIDPDAIAGIVGLPPAVTHTIDHHARGALEGTYPLPTRE